MSKMVPYKCGKCGKIGDYFYIPTECPHFKKIAEEKTEELIEVVVNEMREKGWDVDENGKFLCPKCAKQLKEAKE